jgi:hypothetical protein
MCQTSKRLGIALGTDRLFCESVDPRSHRGESRWLFGPTLWDRTDSEDGHCADVDAPTDGKPQHRPHGADPHPDL